ncbi:hypothetical protein HU200_034255 [Digitaria exilis]|uniref:Uncharacterized protein n=1 Tax=Digitaria exilis TaxID=1010633 RepID=A0A835BJY3_9POAL|nr:hypothetical protein HU200_034255 [Digitaria exilis]
MAHGGHLPIPSVVCLLRLTTEDVRGDWLRFAPTEGSVAYGYRPRPSVLLPATYSSCTVEKKGGGSRTAHNEATGLHSTAAGAYVGPLLNSCRFLVRHTASLPWHTSPCTCVLVWGVYDAVTTLITAAFVLNLIEVLRTADLEGNQTWQSSTTGLARLYRAQ